MPSTHRSWPHLRAPPPTTRSNTLCSWEPIIQSSIDVNKDFPSLFSKNKPEARAITRGWGGGTLRRAEGSPVKGALSSLTGGRDPVYAPFTQTPPRAPRSFRFGPFYNLWPSGNSSSAEILSVGPCVFRVGFCLPRARPGSDSPRLPVGLSRSRTHAVPVHWLSTWTDNWTQGMKLFTARQ